MKNTEKRRMSNYLINLNSGTISKRELQKTYAKYKAEILKNINNSDSFEVIYRYLMESRFYFREIENGYYSPIQLELFPIRNEKKKEIYSECNQRIIEYLSLQIDITKEVKSQTQNISKIHLKKCPEFIWNGTFLDLKILLTLILASKLLGFKGQKSNINANIKYLLALFNHKFTSLSGLKSDIKRAIKHKSCRICANFSHIYQQIFFDYAENKAVTK